MNDVLRMIGCGVVMMGGGAWGDDWPQFRGPTGQGITQAASLPTTWGPDMNVLWKTAIPGKGWSSPVLAGGRIFLTAAVQQGEDVPTADRSLRALCLEAESGKIVWDAEVFAQKGSEAPAIHRKNSHASPTPVIEGGRLYAHFGHQGTACLNAADGKVVWSTREFSYAPVHGAGGTPVIVDDLLIFSADAKESPAVLALDKATGKLRWRFARVSDAKRKFSFATPLLIEVNGQRQLITPGSGVVNALDPKTGEEIWRVMYGEGYSVVPRPVYANGLVHVATGFDKPVALAIKPDGKGDVTQSHVVWEVIKAVPHDPSMVAADGLLYMAADNGMLSCIDAKTGVVHYQERATGPISASLLTDGKHVYLQDEAGLGLVVKAGKSFEIVARNEMKEKTFASLAVTGNDLLLRTESSLFRIGKR